MQKRYICFTCYGFHPEMWGVSQGEFKAGNNVCHEEKCKRKGQPLEEAYLCDVCKKLFQTPTQHPHDEL